MSWYYEHGIIKDVNSDREGFIEQAGEEFVAAMRLYLRTLNYYTAFYWTVWDCPPRMAGMTSAAFPQS